MVVLNAPTTVGLTWADFAWARDKARTVAVAQACAHRLMGGQTFEVARATRVGRSVGRSLDAVARAPASDRRRGSNEGKANIEPALQAGCMNN